MAPGMVLTTGTVATPVKLYGFVTTRASCAPRDARNSSLQAFLRRLFDPASQRWQNWQDLPLLQPLVCTNAQGLHLPMLCKAEPTLGKSSLQASCASIVSAKRSTQSGGGESCCCCCLSNSASPDALSARLFELFSCFAAASNMRRRLALLL
eukprot:CAMPEP_0171083442 /NCGR_PEP_ID=MMETSP0766_2-20121228/17712_1 /TAXON_ID=439317 /ORGANISM="Gambierdiscus australes, Strain CAWD 149" /LENGTH=151 /DNA_ID=CAMNT_0011540869 /DNA_START=157 /DNA_END=612 /DNA_ORIENTATION=-